MNGRCALVIDPKNPADRLYGVIEVQPELLFREIGPALERGIGLQRRQGPSGGDGLQAQAEPLAAVRTGYRGLRCRNLISWSIQFVNF